MPNLRKFMQSFLILLIMAFILSISKIVALYTDYLWFSALGFSKIFTVSLTSKLILFFVAALFFFLFAAINLKIASRIQSSKLPFKISVLIIVLLSVFQGLSASNAWLLFLQYINRVSFNLQDPILGKDVAFYVFSLPFFLFLWKFLFVTVMVTGAIVVLYYLQQFITSVLTPQVDPNTNTIYKSFDFWKEVSKIKRGAMVHTFILASFIFFLLGAKHYFDRFSVMYSENGIVVGAGYTDVVVFLPIVKFLMIFAVIIAALFYVWIIFFSKSQKLGKRHILLFVLIIYLGFAAVGETIIPGIVQSLKVSPNEINLEKPYIENNIKFTKIAYGLDEVEEKDFDVEQNLNAAVLEKEKETISNVRILDYRPLTTTYKQTQEIRLYYDLSGIDIDRYTIDGEYTQVMLAPRELDQNQITENAQTWVNLHMVYSHGFGVVMSPVNEVTKQGLPNYLVKDIPPSYTVKEGDIKVEQPRIYYGEKDNNFVLVNTKTKEFDFPKGNVNEYISYDGKGGVNLDSFIKKFLMALRFADIKILLSSDVTKESKIMFLRNIQHRISKVTPFLMLDNDPYLVIDDGKLYWIQDAYTVTGNFPYSQKFGRINYMRNSVKVVVGAYDGDVTYYVVDKNDPLMKVYSNIFPGQFRNFDDFPEGLKDHLRYPEDLFKVQSTIYSTYHMNDPTVFYNKEDAWQIPYEIYGTGQQTEVEPYYIIMKLPDEKKEEFVLMTTFTPIKKDNMIAWLAARSDKENYGKLLLYKFPKDKLIYGPLQIEARIDQDSEISQQLTLWGQQGSRVTRGNLLVIPIENSLLYIEPLYIQAEKGQLPELKRVLVSDGERVVMEIDLATALEKLFGKSRAVRTTETIVEDRSQEDLIKEAGAYYDSILDAMDKGDWIVFGENFDKLGETLGSLER
jgi:uncharacterized membrane protein (UPF0182 family)|tara:strand:- start:2723 stop:5437 length:2715 start_codon:yes stop_codon:yes gene_type:complete